MKPCAVIFIVVTIIFLVISHYAEARMGMGIGSLGKYHLMLISFKVFLLECKGIRNNDSAY